MKEKILIINDEEPVREMIRLFLQQKEYAVIEAEDGTTGIKKAIDEQPQLILMDVMMPVMDGYEACRQLKQEAKTKDIPVIFLSSLTDPKDKIKGLEAGGVDFITRGSDRGELYARVQTHLNIRALTEELRVRNQQLVQKQKYLDEDLKAAAAIQFSLLPPIDFKAARLDCAWRLAPCDQIGGDIFNAIALNEDQTALYIIDVSGHGVTSAMVTVSVSQYLHEQAAHFQTSQDLSLISPAKMLKALDKEFPLERFDKFFSMFYMVINTKERNLLYSNGGHPPAVLLYPDRPCELLSKGGTVIGVDEGLPYVEEKKEFLPGCKVILYTDGVTEYNNSHEELYGTDRLCGLLEKIKKEPVKKIIDMIFSDLELFGEKTAALDDVSIIAIEFKP